VYLWCRKCLNASFQNAAHHNLIVSVLHEKVTPRCYNLVLTYRIRTYILYPGCLDETRTCEPHHYGHRSYIWLRLSPTTQKTFGAQITTCTPVVTHKSAVIYGGGCRPL
jgi:hypothetical protein